LPSLLLAGAPHATSIACQSSRGELHVRRLEGGEEGALVSGVEGDDGSGARVRADEVVDGEEAAAVLDVLEILVVEGELRGVVVEHCDVEDVHCARRHELRAEQEAVGGRGAVELQAVLDVLAMAASDRMRTCKSVKENEIRLTKYSQELVP
jgi:hypothetical protein